jgi:hypothetical protein
MSMGKRKRDRQPAMWVMATNLPTAVSHPFYRRLNQLLRERLRRLRRSAMCWLGAREMLFATGC